MSQFPPTPALVAPTVLRGVHTGDILACSIHCGLVFTAGYDKVINVWRMGRLMISLTGHTHQVVALTVLSNAENTFLISGSWDQTLRVWPLTPLFTKLDDN